MTNELQQTVADALQAPTRVGSGDLLGISFNLQTNINQ